MAVDMTGFGSIGLVSFILLLLVVVCLFKIVSGLLKGILSLFFGKKPVDDDYEVKEFDGSNLPEQFVVVSLKKDDVLLSSYITEIGAVKVNRDSDRHDAFHSDMEDEENDWLAFVDFIGNLRVVVYDWDEETLLREGVEDNLETDLGNLVSIALDMSKRAFPGLPSYELTYLYAHGDKPLSSKHAFPGNQVIQNCEMMIIVYAASVSQLGNVE